MIFWVAIILVLNMIASFAYSAAHTTEPSTVWAIFVTNYIYFLGISQAGIIFSVAMRLSRSKWGMHFARLGEILTLSFLPFAFIGFIVIYVYGAEHIFYWINPELLHGGGHGEVHISPWLTKGLFLSRNIISLALFYIMSYIYFRVGRTEERGACTTCDMKSRLRILACFVMFFFILSNTFLSWDFGMTIIQHFESSIFSLYYWNGNLLAGVAFLFFISNYFIKRVPGVGVKKKYLDGYAKVLIGFILLWTYLLWSQHVVIWYTDIPQFTVPLFKGMEGNYAPAFIIMLLTGLVVPFFTLIFKRLKLSAPVLSAVTVLLCIAIWINRYLMVVPVFSDGSEPVIFTWTGLSLIFGGMSSVILSIMVFKKIFPSVTTSTSDL